MSQFLTVICFFFSCSSILHRHTLNRKMGLSSAATSKEAIQLCIFDLRRGQHEGQELDKILFFFPADLSFSKQLSVIGLSEGLITFTRYTFIYYYHACDEKGMLCLRSVQRL